MSKTKEAKGTAPKKSGIPMLIIAGVALIAMVGGWYWLTSSQTARTSTNSAGNRPAATPPATAKIPPNAPAGATPPNQTGPAAATVVLEEFADYQCGSCAVAHPVFNEIKSAYGSRIRFIFRNYPLSNHDKAYDVAVAAEAAGLQGKFWEMQNLIFQNQQAWANSPTYKQMMKEYAGKISLDVEKWESDMAGMMAKQRVDADLARGRAAAVSSTPSLFINGSAVPFSEMNLASLKRLIDAELAKTSAPAPAANGNAAPAGNTAGGSNANK